MLVVRRCIFVFVCTLLLFLVSELDNVGLRPPVNRSVAVDEAAAARQAGIEALRLAGQSWRYNTTVGSNSVRLLVVHTMKCGGTTVCEWLAALVASPATMRETHCRVDRFQAWDMRPPRASRLPDLRQVVNMDAPRLLDFAQGVDGLGFEIEQPLPTLPLPSPSLLPVVVLVRHPLARLVSYYVMVRDWSTTSNPQKHRPLTPASAWIGMMSLPLVQRQNYFTRMVGGVDPFGDDASSPTALAAAQARVVDGTIACVCVDNLTSEWTRLMRHIGWPGAGTTNIVERDARDVTTPLIRAMMNQTIFGTELLEFFRENRNDIALLRTVAEVRTRRDARVYLGDSACDLGEDLWRSLERDT